MFDVVTVEISNEPIDPGKPFTDRQTGNVRPAVGRQKAYLHSGNAYPLPFQIRVDDASGPIRPGFYCVGGGDAFKIGQYGPELVSSKMKLVPVGDAIEQLKKLNPTASLKAAG